MKRTSIFLYLLIGILVIGCNDSRIIEEHNDNFPNNRWERSNIVEFKTDIDDIDSKYQISIAFRHVYGFQLKKLKLKMEIIAPSGKSKTHTYKLKVVKGANEYYSECAGDYCDLVDMVEKRYKFKEEGTYKIKITQDTNVDPIPNVMEVGIIIDKIIKENK